MFADITTTARFDLPRLIKDLGGPTRIRALLFAQNMKPVQLRTLYAWSNGQNAGTTSAVALMCALARRLDPTFEASDYIVEETERAECGF